MTCPYAIAWADLNKYSEGGNGEISLAVCKAMRTRGFNQCRKCERCENGRDKTD
jgi:hypothetical protein